MMIKNYINVLHLFLNFYIIKVLKYIQYVVCMVNTQDKYNIKMKILKDTITKNRIICSVLVIKMTGKLYRHNKYTHKIKNLYNY